MSHDSTDLQSIEDEFNAFLSQRDKEVKRETKRETKAARRAGTFRSTPKQKTVVCEEPKVLPYPSRRNMPSHKGSSFVEGRSFSPSFMAAFLVPFLSGLSGVLIGSVLVMLFLGA